MQAPSLSEYRFRVIFFAALAALLLSKGLTLLPGYSVDDYAVIQAGRFWQFYISQLRFTQAAIQIAINFLELNSAQIAWPVTLVSLPIAALLIAYGLEFVTNKRGSVFLVAPIASVLGSHPYLTEYFTFREFIITQGTSFLLVTLLFA